MGPFWDQDSSGWSLEDLRVAGSMEKSRHREARGCVQGSQRKQRLFLPVTLNSVFLPLPERNETGRRGPVDESRLPLAACLSVWVRKGGCTEQRPQPGSGCHHHTSGQPATSPPSGWILTRGSSAEAAASRPGILNAAKPQGERPHCRTRPRGGSTQAAAVPPPAGRGAEGRRGSGQRPAWQRCGHRSHGEGLPRRQRQ